MPVINAFKPVILIAVVLYLSACSFNTVVDVSDYQLKAQATARPLSSNIMLSSQNLKFTHHKTGTRAIPGNVGHDLSSLNVNYVEQVKGALFTTQQTTADAHKGILMLESIDMVQVIGEGFADFDVSEQLVAKWQLYNRDLSERIFSFEVSGRAAGKTGWGDGIAANARDRFGRAYQNLLDNTISAFSNSDDLKQFNLVADFYLDAQAGTEVARQVLANAPAADHAGIVASIRSIAVKRASLELYNFCRNQIDQNSLDAIRDESALFHTALESDVFNRAIVENILQRMQDLERLNDDGMTPLEAALEGADYELAVALVKAGAGPNLKLAGDTYISAEVTYQLIDRLQQAGVPHQASVKHALRLYDQAIKETNYAIGNNEASIFAKNVVNVIGPFIQRSVARAEAKAEAKAFGTGVGIYSPVKYDTSDPAQAIAYLKDRVRHCQARIDALKQLI